MVKDIRLNTGFLDHPKTIKLLRRLGWEGVKSLLLLWFFAALNRCKGILSNMTPEDIAIAAGWQQDVQQFVDCLLELGWLDVSENGETYSLHDWEEHQGFIFYSEERREIAIKAGRASAYKRLLKANPQQGVQRSVKHGVQQKSKKSSTPSPSPSPLPSPIKEILSYLNAKSERSFRETTKITQSVINARFKEGFTVDDFKQVIDIKVPKWKNNPKMSDYLRPETLFGPKFEGYLNESANKTDWRG